MGIRFTPTMNCHTVDAGSTQKATEDVLVTFTHSPIAPPIFKSNPLTKTQPFSVVHYSGSYLTVLSLLSLSLFFRLPWGKQLRCRPGRSTGQ